MTRRIHCKAGSHALDIFGDDGRWFVAVDGAVLRGRFTSEEAARAAGLAEVDRLGRPAGSPARAIGAGVPG